MYACIDRMCGRGSSVCVRTSMCYHSMVYMYLWTCRQAENFLRFGKLKSNFFKEFSQNQYIIAHTLQDPVRTNCRFENVENETTQHKLYTIDEITHTIHSVYIHNCKAELSSTVSLVYTQIHVVYREPRRRNFLSWILI